MARLLSVNVGLPRDIAWQAKTVHTAVWKAPVQGRRMARRLNIEGDGQGDLTGHGGEHRAVFVYQIASYRYWQDQLGRSDFDYGQFGENFTVDGLPDDEVCIGDYYRIGDAVFEVTQPRVTCYRVGIRMNEPQMAALLVAHGRPGFYFRVLEAGEVEAGDEIVQVAAGPEHMTVAEVNALLYMPGHPKGELEKALRIPALSAGWRGSFQALLEREQSGSPMTGNPGLSPAAGPPPAWAGFRPLRVSHKNRESSTVTSLMLESTDGRPLQAALPGQFIVLRLKPAPDSPALLRSYSLSGEPSEDRYRISVKRETPCRGRGLHRRGSPGRRRARGERATRQLHAGAGRRPRRPAECGHRRDPGARDASRVGSGGVTARDLVDLRRPKRRRASVCGRDARPA
jgi:MOSC domain-containing protein YiiM